MASGIFFDSLTGVLSFLGTDQNDKSSVQQYEGNGGIWCFIATQVTLMDDNKTIQNMHRYDGYVADLKKIEYKGFKGNDLFANYTNAPALAYGGEGNDRLIGNNGSDTLWGNEGSDKLEGWNGNDCLMGGNGTDYVYGMKGRDTMHGGMDTVVDFSDKSDEDQASKIP